MSLSNLFNGIIISPPFNIMTMNLPLSDLIGIPLSAAGQAQKQLSQTTVDFINELGFTEDGKTLKTIEFRYLYNPDTTNPNIVSPPVERLISFPLLVILKIPSLKITTTEISFLSEASETVVTETVPVSSYKSSYTPMLKLNILGKVTSDQKIKRTTNTSSTYSVKVTATDDGVPEGLARVLDMFVDTMSKGVLGGPL
jgi:hypothetical protein